MEQYADIIIDLSVKNVDRIFQYRIPAHLQDAHYKSAAKLGHGVGYQYSHDFPHHYVKQQYLPDEAKTERFYQLSEERYAEKSVKRNHVVQIF